MKRFGLRALFFTVIALVVQTSSVKAADGDAVDDRVRERLNSIYGTGPLPPTAGYTLTELAPGADNWWQDANGLVVNGLRVISADTTIPSTNPASPTINDRILQTVGFYDNGGTFQQLVSSGNGKDGLLYSYTLGGSTVISGTTATGANSALLNSQGSGVAYTTDKFNGLAPFEFGVLTDRSTSIDPTKPFGPSNDAEVGSSSLTVNAGGIPALGTLGSNRSSDTQFRAYRLTTNQDGEPPLPDSGPGTNSYVLVFYNFNGLNNTLANTAGYDFSAAGTGGLVAFIVTGVVNPEPGSMVLLATGLVGIAGYRLRRKRAVPTEISVS